jgi:hypothetical protein
MNAIAPIAAADSAMVTTEPQADSLFGIVARAVADPSTDPERLKAFLALYQNLVAEDARLQYIRAMNAAQAEMHPIVRDATNESTSSKYARLETIDAAIRPIYTRHRFRLAYNTETVGDGDIRVMLAVSHTAGHTEQFQLESAADRTGPQGKVNKTEVQGIGSTVSYLRRYLLCLAFNIVLTSDDNDGNRRAASRPSDDGLLAEHEVNELWDLMKRTHTAEGKFLAAVCPGLRSIGQVPAKDFPRLKNALLHKASVQHQRAVLAAAALAAAATTPKGAVQ